MPSERLNAASLAAAWAKYAAPEFRLLVQKGVWASDDESNL